MKLAYFLMLTAASATAYAQQPPLLPPVVDNSTYRGTLYEPQPQLAAPQSTFPSMGGAGSPPGLSALPPLPAAEGLTRLQNDLTQIKNKVDEQARVLTTLKQRQDAIEQRILKSKAGTPIPAPQPANVGGGFDAAATVPASATSTGEKGSYQTAITSFKKGQIDQAITEFQRVISTYPTGKLAANSQYWIGESLLKKGDKQGAMVAFDQVLHMYPTSAKVPDALLKLGLTQLTLKNKAKAKEYFDFLTTNYPNTPSAGIAASKKSQTGL